MKTKLFFIALLALGFSYVEAQSQTTVYAKNSDISDNLDLRAVASIFGESANLQDFERRLNDPKYQISNLDLNDDDQVDYLRVIESVEKRTHVIIIQSVLDRDIYQDIATIDVERDNNNKVVVQVVGNSYLYGANYIYEPVYNVTPVIYTSFWVPNYRPYYSSWTWNFYPTYYYAWRPYPVYRYRNNINVCINVNNHYNYVNTRRSYRAPVLYESRRAYGYETRRPNYGFAQRHSNINNRYELDQRRVANRETNRNSNKNYSTNRLNTGRISGTENRNYTVNRTASDRSNNANRVASSKNNSAKTNNPVKIENSPRTESRGYSNENRKNSEANYNTNRVASSRDNSTKTNNPIKADNSSRTVSRGYSNENRSNSENKTNSNRTTSPQRTEAPRNYSENKSNTSKPQSAQRSESPRVSQESRSSQPQRENSSNSRGGGRRI
ncbi:hypothetical protein [Flavobacterium piscis]|uniref:DUF3300 domain-containing protein n=1 Tax=Flavobacterium piscis TaxID=1114874 RepID=A0ABU1YF11_9FLAO|nr:hypothetical protein [Flavobacterium piscis]MDR7212688.1 hypothetical protein [Flavobacterium piscis]